MKIIMEKICVRTGEKFTISDFEKSYLEERGIPLPDVSPAWRTREQYANRNEGNMFERICDKTKKTIISSYRPDAPFPVYSNEAWYSEEYDGLAYGRDYDFSRTFFEQFRDLLKTVPRPSRQGINMENSPYVHLGANVKSCFLTFVSWDSEDCYYGFRVFKCRNCVDCTEITECELCYECVDCGSCYNVRWGYHSFNSRDSAMLYMCRNCTDCFGCVGLEHKKYCIWNVEYSKEEYEQKIKEMNLGSRKSIEELQKKFWELVKEKGLNYSTITNSEDCTGTYIDPSAHCKNSIFIKESNNILNGYHVRASRDTFDVAGVAKCELVYRSSSMVSTYDSQFGCMNQNNLHAIYCNNIYGGGEYLFGCVGFSRKQNYCILNKQYTKEEYHELLPRIKKHMESTGEWGQFFPLSMADFPYVDTIAQQHFPISSDEEAKRLGVYWLGKKAFTTTETAISIPDTIDQVDESICDQVLQDAETHRAYKLQKKELAFYKQMGIPVPVYSFNTRNDRRSKILFQI